MAAVEASATRLLDSQLPAHSTIVRDSRALWHRIITVVMDKDLLLKNPLRRIGRTSAATLTATLMAVLLPTALALAADADALRALSGLSEEQRAALQERFSGDDAALDQTADPLLRGRGTTLRAADRIDQRGLQSRRRDADSPDADQPQARVQPARRYMQLTRGEQLAVARACTERLRDRKLREKERGELAWIEIEADKKGPEAGEVGIDERDVSARDLRPRDKDGRLLDPNRCNDDELEDYLAENDPFGRVQDRPAPFGYDLFDQAADSFSPETDIPVPTDYVLGPGDKVEVQLFGKENRRLALTVTRDGILQFPQLGPIGVAGMSFDDVRDMLEAQVAESMIGVQASVTMGTLRSIRVFVLGDVRQPGSYTVSSLSTMTNALFVGGGIRETGSLRAVQLKRGGRVVTTLDLYDLLLSGDTSRDLRLQPGDVVFIPPVGKTVSVSGEVVRPATYELSGAATVNELVELGGGLLPSAYVQNVSLERIRGQTDRTIATLDLSKPAGGRTAVQTGDHLRVFSVFDRAENVVMLTGAFERPGLVQWSAGMRLSDAIPDLHRLKPRADTNYVLIRREVGEERRLKMISAHLAEALRDPNSQENLPLHSRDQLVVFPAGGSREDLLEPIVEQLKQQADMTQEAQLVEIVGRVKSPGTYPLTAPMTITELIRAAGGGTDDAYPREVEVTRRSVVEGQRREIKRIVVDLSDPVAAATPLSPYDTVNVRPIEGWNETEKVTLSGEVKLPGEYVIQPNETMESVIRRAGGFTEQAYLPGAVFSREEIRKRQQEELNRQARRLRAELLQVQLDYRGPDKQDVDANRVRQLGALLSEELADAEALGRVVVDMPPAASGEKPLALRGGDSITIPRKPSEVTVLGEVSYPTTHLFQESYSYKDYMRLSGGFSARADKSAAFVVRINGEVVALDRAEEAMPGDVIIVPFKVDRGRGLFITATIAQIIGQLAITAASFKTVGVF